MTALCNDVWRQDRARGCRLPANHPPPCDAKFRYQGRYPGDDDVSEDVLRRQERRDEELKAEERA